MLPEDRDDFVAFVQQHDPVLIVQRDSESLELEALAGLNSMPDKTLIFWNRSLLSSLKRKWIPDPGYYRVDGLHTPTLEFTQSFYSEWEGKPALVQGRLFGDFDQYLAKPPGFEKWYETLVRWIRKNYQKNPCGYGGYVGPAAYEFYKKDGYLLPQTIPPRTDAWLEIISKQHTPPRKRRR
jgi:hypothetical protein